MNEEIIKQLNKLHSKVDSFKTNLQDIISELHKQNAICPKCRRAKKGICDIACHCWMLETGKITQSEYDNLIKKKVE